MSSSSSSSSSSSALLYSSEYEYDDMIEELYYIPSSSPSRSSNTRPERCLCRNCPGYLSIHPISDCAGCRCGEDEREINISPSFPVINPPGYVNLEKEEKEIKSSSALTLHGYPVKPTLYNTVTHTIEWVWFQANSTPLYSCESRKPFLKCFVCKQSTGGARDPAIMFIPFPGTSRHSRVCIHHRCMRSKDYLDTWWDINGITWNNQIPSNLPHYTTAFNKIQPQLKAKTNQLVTNLDKYINRDTSYYEKEVQRYTCSICHSMIFDAMEIPCPGAHLFCRLCLVQLGLQKKKDLSCPCCNHPFQSNDVRSNGHVNQLITEILTPCIYDGCKEKILPGTGYRLLLEHQKTCEYGEVTCERCEKIYKKKDKEIHDIDCLKLCVYCGGSYLITETHHVFGVGVELCSYMSRCELCGSLTQKGNLDNHMKNDCKERVIYCYFCETTFKASNTKHITDNPQGHLDAIEETYSKRIMELEKRLKSKKRKRSKEES